MVHWEGNYILDGYGVTMVNNEPKVGRPQNVKLQITKLEKNVYKILQTGVGVSGNEILQEGLGIVTPDSSELTTSGSTPNREFIWTFQPIKTKNNQVVKFTSKKIRIPGEVYYFAGKRE